MIFKFIKKAVKGVLSGAKKLVKSVGGALKKLAPALLIAAPLIFTSGAAGAFMTAYKSGGLMAGLKAGGSAVWAGLGNLGTSIAEGFRTGGFGGAAKGLAQGLGLRPDGIASKLVTSAVQYGGYGGATGAATAMLTGGDAWEGFKQGAKMGAVAGAGATAIGHAFPGTSTPVGGDAGGTAASGTTTAPGGARGFLNKAVGALSEPAVLGPVLQGAMQGAGGYLEQRDAMKAAEEARRRRQQSYEGVADAMRVGPTPEPPRVGAAPDQPVQRTAMDGTGVYVFDKASQTYTFVPDERPM